MIKEGDKIDLQTRVNVNSEVKTLADFMNEFLVIYFYPKDNTPGCTAQACSFRDFNSEIKSLGANVIGVSSDDEQSHQKFTNDHTLNFPLIADTDLTLHEMFGTNIEKNLLGKKINATSRSTFLLNKNGEVLKTWEDVDPQKNPSEVLEFLKQIER